MADLLTPKNELFPPNHAANWHNVRGSINICLINNAVKTTLTRTRVKTLKTHKVKAVNLLGRKKTQIRSTSPPSFQNSTFRKAKVLNKLRGCRQTPGLAGTEASKEMVPGERPWGQAAKRGRLPASLPRPRPLPVASHEARQPPTTSGSQRPLPSGLLALEKTQTSPSGP